MPRSIWKGSISFGLLNVPVTVYPGEQRTDLSFHLVDSRNHARVRYQRVNEETGEEVPWDEIVKAFEYDESGHYVLLTEEDFAQVAVEADQTVEIQAFVPRDDIETVFFERPYYLAPGKRGEKGYVLLREVLARTGKVGLARVVIRTREYLAALMPWGDALVLELLRYHQELRDPAELDLPTGSLADYKITKKELEMAETLVEAMTGAWDPGQFKDEYRSRLLAWIEKKAGGGARVAVAEREDRRPAKVVDIMSVLKESIAQKKGGRSASPASARGGATRKKAARKKTAAKAASTKATKRPAAKKRAAG